MNNLRLPLDEDREINLRTLRAELEEAGIKVEELNTVNDDGEHLELEIVYEGKTPAVKKVLAVHESTRKTRWREARALLLRVAIGDETKATADEVAKALVLVWVAQQPEWEEMP